MEFLAHDIEYVKHITTEQALWVLGILAAVAVIGYILWRVFRRPDAWIYVPEGIPLAQFRYQDIPMKKCAFCGRTVNLAHHHITAWAAAPELKDDPNNIVVLCAGKGGGCHKCIGHGHNYHRFNANILETIKSARWVTSDEYYKETHGGKDRTEIRK